MFGEYDQVNFGNDLTIKTKDALFYYQLGRGMYDSGFRNFDSISVDTYLSDKADTRKVFSAYGGYPEVEKLKSLVDVDNVEAYFDRISKLNTLSDLCEQFFKTFQDTSRFDSMSNSQVYDFFDYQLNTISMNSTRDMKVESVAFDESYITELDKGETVGLNYGKNCPRLNWATLGLPLGDLYMLGGFSGTGKTSFVFENMILPLTESGVKCCIISNEMQVRAYKQLLTIHILTNDLGYWKMTRKHLKVGKFTDEQKEMLLKAAAISQKKYSSIRFIFPDINHFGKDLFDLLAVGKGGGIEKALVFHVKGQLIPAPANRMAPGKNSPPPSRWIKPKSTSSPFSIKPVTMKTVSNFCMKQTSAGTTGKRSAIVPSAMTM